MKIDTDREGGAAVLRLEGRFDREWAEHLSDTLEDLLQDGVRSLTIDFAGVTYVSSEASKVLARWHKELTILRGDVHLTALSPKVREAFAVAGWDPGPDGSSTRRSSGSDLRRSSWHARAGFANCGQYEVSASTPRGTLTAHLHGNPGRLTQAPIERGECETISLPNSTFGLGLGAIGGSCEECYERLGELVAVAGCVAYFPTDGARMADYLVGEGQVAPRAVLASGLTCEGGFSQLLRFSTQPDAEAVPLSELASIGLEASGAPVAGMIIAGETARLAGARLLKPPVQGEGPAHFEVPAVRDWLSFAPEGTYSMTTALLAGVVAREPSGPLGAYLRPLGGGRLHGHFHAAVFSYHPLPQRTVELTQFVRGLFANHELRDVLHLVGDDRGEAGVGESALVRGVGWVGPVIEVR